MREGRMKKPNAKYRDNYSASQIETLYQLAANGCTKSSKEYDWATRDMKTFGE